MATKIQLRRDYAANWQATNPVLSLGEPGVELDTHAMKVGNGVTAWNDLAYVQTSGDTETLTENMFVKLNGMDNDIGPPWAGTVSVSTDGINWTPSFPNKQFTSYQKWDINGLAVGGGYIVYRTYEYAEFSDQNVSRYELRFAHNPFEQPQKPTSDNVRRGPLGEEIHWWNVRYVNGYFIAVGSYYDDDRDDYRYPVAVYSTDGDNWTNINIDLSYMNTLIEAERGAHSNDVSGIAIGDVAYGTNGWLFAMHWDYDGTGISRNPAGAFYITSITAALNVSSRIAQIPGSYFAAFDGHGWVAWANYDAVTGGPAAYFNSNSDPRTGSWRTVDLREKFRAINGDNFYDCIQDVAAGQLGDTNWIVFSDGQYGVYATSDQGLTWKILQTTPNNVKIFNTVANTPVRISNWNNSQPYDGERVTIEGSRIAELNGTFHTKYNNGGYIELYHDTDLTDPVVSVGSNGLYSDVDVTGRFGDYTVIVDDASDLRVGMVAEGYNGLTNWEVDNTGSSTTGAVNKILSIDGNNVTMQFPWNGDDGDTVNIEFTPVMYRSRGDGIANICYGDGAFIGFSWDNLERAYRTTDLNTWQSTTLGRAAQNTWIQNVDNTFSVAYGTVTTHGALLRSHSNTVPGYTNFLSVSDIFTLQIANGDPQWTRSGLSEDQAFGTGGITIDPSNSQWAISTSVTGSEGFYGFGSTYTNAIATYNDGEGYWDDNQSHNSVVIKSYDYYWNFENDSGYFYSERIAVGQGEGYDNEIYGDSVIHGIYLYDEASDDTNNSDQFVDRGIYVNNGTFIIDSALGTGLPNTPNFSGSTPFTAGGALPAAIYTIYIVAFDDSGRQAYPSSPVTVTTTGATSMISLSWNSYSDNQLRYVYGNSVNYYRIFFSNNQGLSQRYQQVNGDITSYTIYNNGGTVQNIQFIDQTGNDAGFTRLSYDGGTNYTQVDYFGTHINTEDYQWNFSNDCNGDDYGVVYQPDSALLQTPGYWKIGDYQGDWTEQSFIQGYNYYGGPGDIRLYTYGQGDGYHNFYFTRYGELDMDYDGYVQSIGYWRMGDGEGYDSYTYIGATDYVDGDPYDIEIAADDTYFYFTREGKIVLPPGGDIVDNNDISVLGKEMAQTKVTSGDYTLVYNDRGGHIYNTGTGKIKIPTNAGVAFPIGTVITIISADNSFTVEPLYSGTTTIIVSNSGASTSVPIPANTYSTVLKIDTDRWIIERAS